METKLACVYALIAGLAGSACAEPVPIDSGTTTRGSSQRADGGAGDGGAMSPPPTAPTGTASPTPTSAPTGTTSSTPPPEDPPPTPSDDAGSTMPTSASCTNGVADGRETDVDCGGPACAPCENGATCQFSSDCASGTCYQRSCQGSCSDGELNGDESDVDCGGLDCAPCGLGATCMDDGDCEGGNCADGTCAESLCGNGMKDSDEADVDCGGSCAPCSEGDACMVGGDCATQSCEGGVCVAPACTPQANCECLLEGGAVYQLCTSSESFDDAASTCEAAGMALAQIDDEPENSLLRSKGDDKSLGEFWIGGSDQAMEGTWVWPDGTTFWTGTSSGTASGYANWKSGEPNDLFGQHCAVMTGAGKWDDASCTDQRKFICEL